MNRFQGWLIKTILLCGFLFTGFYSCKDSYTSVIPYVYVNQDILIKNYIELNIPAGTIYIGGVGYGGIIIVNNWGDSANPYLVFDAACTHEVSSSVHVEVKENGTGLATCPECGSQFMLFGGYGSPIKGPAKEPLKQYRVISVNGRLIITN